MRRTSWTRWAVVGLVAVVVVAFNDRPRLWGSQPSAPIALAAVNGAFGGGQGGEGEPAYRAIHVLAPPMSLEATKVWLKLQEKVSMNFPNDTPLEDVKKYVEQSTREEKGNFPTGIPIYVDPQGLKDSDKTMASTITMNVEGMPLALTLKLLLKQLNLAYTIQKDGLLIITSQDAEEVTDGSTRVLEELGALRAEVQALHREIRAVRPAGPMEKSEASTKSAAPK